VIRNRTVLLMHAEMALTVAIGHIQRAKVDDGLLVRLLEAKRDLLVARAKVEAEAAQPISRTA
jgi:hypothetical protein